MKKVLLIVAFLALTAVASNATLRPRWVVPVNQVGQADSVALPCEPKTINAADNTAVTPLLALGEAGAVYWVNIDKAATAGDYAVLRDSATANTTSTALVKFANDSTTASKMVVLNPPMQFSNGLSVNVSSQTTGVTVCVREADGGL